MDVKLYWNPSTSLTIQQINQIKRFVKEMNWTEEITVKLHYQLLTKKELENAKDNEFGNKWRRYNKAKQVVEQVIEDVLEDKDIKKAHLLDKISAFKKLVC